MYKGGAEVAELGQHSELIPDALPGLLDELRTALATDPAGAIEQARAVVACWDAKG